MIQPLTALPQVTDHVTIDGSAELNANGFPLVSIDGGPGAPPSLYGLELQVAPFFGTSVIRALAFTRWDLGNGAGLRLDGVGGMSRVQQPLRTGCHRPRARERHRSQCGRQQRAHDRRCDAGERNIMSGNVTGLASLGHLSTNVIGNWIGVGLDGT